MNHCLIKNFLAAAAMLSALTSCNNDALDTPPSGKIVKVTAKASVDHGDDSRSALSEKNGSIAFAWSSDDRLLVTDESGTALGILDIDNAQSGTFSGTLTGLNEGRNDINIYHFGTSDALPASVADASSLLSLDISSQEGKLTSLRNTDMMFASTSANVTGSEATISFTVTRSTGFAHYKLNFTDGTTLSGNRVTVSGTNLYNRCTFNLDGSIADKTSGDITVENSDGDIYLTIIPERDMALTFTVTVDGNSYSGTLPSRTYNANRFFRKAQGEGVEVTMNAVKENDNTSSTEATLIGPEITLGDNKYRFTGGNLFFNTKTRQWGVFGSQTEYVTKRGWNEDTPEIIDLFGWGATGIDNARQPQYWDADKTLYPSIQETENQDINEIKATQYDWGTAYGRQLSVDVHDGTYVTPTKDEWNTILSTFFIHPGTVNGIKGLLILPCDNSDATKAKEILSTVGISQDDISSIKLGQTDALDYTKIVLDSNNQLTAMNSVFLPLAGYSSPFLNGEKNSGLTVYYWASSGSYRAAGSNKVANGYCVRIANENLGSSDFSISEWARNYGNCVRLLKKVN
ncbi:hypothetical protein [uncultured Muribaculum sp.]|uniref:hypothetical protein n=1 Tax=uncultured Muribaculum sp. TaxID=1918613 RepID=UPI002657ABB9|nr:hypothetical protein [uncultured Muribaculum sp.]